jgi:uncharacterized protein YjiS (DUF1127 family)
MKPDLAVALRPHWPRDHGFGSAGQHWHQPILPYDYIPAGGALTAISSLLARHAVVARKLAALCKLWVRRRDSRRRLAELDAYELRDIGMTYADAWQESSKPFWRA